MKIPGLTQFLSNEHYKRIGVYTKSEDALFKFWKQYVSSHHKQIRTDKLMKSKAAYGDGSFANISPTKKRGVSRGKNRSIQKYGSGKENGADNGNENSIFALYKKYDNQFEADVLYTIQ